MFLFYFFSIARMIKLRILKVMWSCNLCREHMMYIWNFGGEIQKKATVWNKLGEAGKVVISVYLRGICWRFELSHHHM